MSLLRSGLSLSSLLLMVAVMPEAALGVQDSAAVATPPSLPPPDSSQAEPAEGRVVLPIVPPDVPAGPLPPGTRYRFTRDSMAWSSAVTVADLLGSVPGVYVARAGFLGQAEYVLYGGRGTASVEVYWDGLPMEPVGGDSVFLDLGRIGLAYLKQVDVEILPAQLRIYVVSERHETLEPRSVVRFASGSFGTAEYAGLFQRRWASGFGLNLAADFVGSDGDRDVNRDDQILDLWAKVEWLPNPRVGAEYQIRRQRQERDAFPSADQAEEIPVRDGSRTEFLLRLFAGTRDDGFGWRAEGGLGSTSWTGDSLVGDQHIRQAFARLQYTRPDVNGEVFATVGDHRTKSRIEGRLSWVPFKGIVVSGEGRVARHEGNRLSRVGSGSIGVYWGPFSVVGQASIRNGVQAPSVITDAAQRTEDFSVQAGIVTRTLTGHLGVARRDAFVPIGTPDLPFIAAWLPSPAADYVLADVQFRPWQPLTLSGSYSHPRGPSATLQPPTHGRVAATFRSKFWRTFRSGIFDFKLEYAVESWSTGMAGLDAGGNPILLGGATFHEVFLQYQLVDFKIFWNLRNARNTDAAYVPFRPYPKNAQFFGVKWEFAN